MRKGRGAHQRDDEADGDSHAAREGHEGVRGRRLGAVPGRRYQSSVYMYIYIYVCVCVCDGVSDWVWGLGFAMGVSLSGRFYVGVGGYIYDIYMIYT